MSTSILRDLLFEFEDYLKAINPAVINNFKPGVSRVYINRLVNSIGISSEEAEVLFEWKNGIDTTGNGI